MKIAMLLRYRITQQAYMAIWYGADFVELSSFQRFEMIMAVSKKEINFSKEKLPQLHIGLCKNNNST